MLNLPKLCYKIKMSLTSESRFCLFCYKSIDHSTQSKNNSDFALKFIKFVSQYVKVDKTLGTSVQTVQWENIFAVNYLVKSCERCKIILEDFCNKYHQMKVLEMELDWKLDKLIEKINYANKVPARWIHVNKVLEEVFENNLGDKINSQNSIRKFRQNVVQAAYQRRQQSQPRILVKRADLSKVTTQPIQIHSRSPSPIENLPETMDTIYQPRRSNFRKLHPDKKCPKCKKQLKTFKGLRVHLENHKDSSEWKYTCSTCGKKFSYVENLKVHVRSHTGEKPYKCGFCPQALRHRHSYTKHLRVYHKNEETFEYELNKKFLSTKVKPKKPERKRKIYNCPKCGKTLLTLKGLQIHVELHNGRNSLKWTCEQCGRKFSDKGNLQVHMRIHNDIVLYKCNFCGKKLHFKRGLNKHLKAMHSTEETLDKELKRRWEKKPTKNEKIKEDKSANFIESRTVPRNDENSSENEHSDVKGHFADDVNLNEGNLETMDTTDATFEDPLIQIKVEPLTFMDKNADDAEDSLGNIHSTLHSTEFSEQINKTPYPEEKRKESATETVEPESEIAHSTKRYSFREKRSKNVRYFEEFDTENDEMEYLNESSKSGHSSSKTTIEKNTEKLSSPSPASRNLKCEICTRKFANRTVKSYHFKKCHDLTGKPESVKKINCAITGCAAYFLNQKQLEFHGKLEHKIMTTKTISLINTEPFACSTCGKTFKHKSVLELHEQYHSGPSSYKFECVHCGQKCPTMNKLKMHIKVHKGEKPYGSPAWAKLRKERGKLNQVKVECVLDEDLETRNNDNVHTEMVCLNDERILKCTICGDIFGDQSYFDIHLEQHREVPKERNKYECQFCDKSFETVVMLKQHFKLDHTRDLGTEINDEVEVERTTEKDDNIFEELDDDKEEEIGGETVDENESGNVDQVEVVDEMVNEDMDVFGRKADVLVGETLVDLEDLD